MRNLTPYGKVSIIKSLLMSKITHMLLSLPSPSDICLKDLYNTFSKFLWSGKPPKWNKEILEGEIHHGGLKLHNIALFDQTLKLSWLRRFLKSKSIWTIFPNSFELVDVFTFGLEYIKRTIEMTSNNFWIDVIKSLQTLWKSKAVQHRDVICNTPLWLHNSFQLPIRRAWQKRGINSIADLLGPNNTTITMEEFTSHFGVKTNFLEFSNICHKINKFLEWKDLPPYSETLPRNSTVNILINKSSKGCSKLYTMIKDSNDTVLDNIVNKWSEKSELEMESICISRSFIKHHTVYKDTYLKYIQFRTLHHRFFTNDILFCIGIKPSNICGMCNMEIDSNEHMFLECIHSIRVWSDVRDWIIQLGMIDYNLSDMRKIIGDMENALAINCIILLTKKVIYNAMKKERPPHFINVKFEAKNVFYQ